MRSAPATSPGSSTTIVVGGRCGGTCWFLSQGSGARRHGAAEGGCSELSSRRLRGVQGGDHGPDGCRADHPGGGVPNQARPPQTSLDTLSKVALHVLLAGAA